MQDEERRRAGEGRCSKGVRVRFEFILCGNRTRRTWTVGANCRPEPKRRDGPVFAEVPGVGVTRCGEGRVLSLQCCPTFPSTSTNPGSFPPAMSKFTPSPQEVALVNQIFAQADAQKLGVVTGEAAVKIFGGTKLPPSTLAEVWNLADDDNKGVLTRKDVAVAVRLLGHAQRGERISESLIHKRTLQALTFRSLTSLLTSAV